ncbi:hypothetical protein EFA46_003690 [Halarchaeum sp. CBA1220]|uniref:DUF5789 family protein n=1 Tax=Halarchaeum sp. CBA1220 TaxID=1853682 RepID=UPI000F3A92AF|nr:hypothetical protein [Halarchaeum sp. CBA1220]QLC33344.1 hypothetical protein EFA46_003690 [Halarchaeum sp. CBA1220]
MTLRTATDLLEDASYPTTTDDLRATYGNVRIEHPAGVESLDEVLARTGEEEFADATEAVHAVIGAVGQDAVGRVGYSDRDPTPMGVDGHEPVSF